MSKNKNKRKSKTKKKNKKPLIKRLIGFFNITDRYNVKRLIFIAVFISTVLYVFWGLPLPTNLTKNQYAVSTKIYDRQGELIYEIYDDQRRTPIKIEEVPDHVKNATIAIEDKDFYKHSGFDVLGIIRGLSKQFTKGRAEGGSTLTQQLVKNALLNPNRTIRRKLREFVLSVIVESIYSKDQILELYLNQIPYGGTAYGIESASELYFDKQAKDLTLAEAALLAGLPAAPSRYSPFGSRPEEAFNRQHLVLSRMVEDGYISQEEADEAKEQELDFAKTEEFKAPHFALWVKEILSERFGNNVVEQGGLRVNTTLDLELQEFAEDAVATEVAKLADRSVGNGAALVTRPETGEILAMVGSKNYFAEDEDGKVNIIFANRQPGSSIKPLNYALGLAEGNITASVALADIPTCFISAGSPSYCPKNYSGGFHGLVPVRFALGNSYNIPAVRVLALNGIEEFIDFATKMGITTFTEPKNYGLSLTLGGGEVRPYDMATAFGVFANGGEKKSLIAITKVTDYNGKVLYEIDPQNRDGERIIAPGVAFLISHILHDNNARTAAFGSNSLLNVPDHPEVSVKTGTTNDLRDNWTVGYTRHALVVVWVGNNDNSPMSGAVSGVSGATPIWNTIIGEVLDKAESGYYDPGTDGHAWPLQTDDIIGRSVCAITGKLPNEGEECATRFEYFLEDYPPQIFQGGLRRDVFVFKDTGMLANDEALPEQVETKSQLIYYDPLGTSYCLDCPNASSAAIVRYPLTQ